MGTTAQKLTYLNDTKGLLKDSINSLGGNITSQTTFRNYVTELDSIYSNLPKVSGTGSILSLTPTLKGRLESVLKGNTLQNGTPSPSSPVEIQSATGLQNITVCGKNLFDKSSAIIGKYYNENCILITPSTNGFCELININESLKYSLKIDNNYGSTIRLIIFVFDKNLNKLVALRWSDTLASGSSYTIQNYTMPSGAKYITISVLDMQPTTENIEKIPIQLEVGSATTYEEYQSQTKELNLGKNLIPTQVSEWEQGSFIPTTGVPSESTTRLRIKNFYTINNNIDYFISVQDTDYCFLNLMLYDKNKNFVGQYYDVDTQINGATSLKINIPSSLGNVYYYKAIIRNQNSTTITADEITDIKPQIEKGSQATTYSPYFTPIKLNKIGDYQDYITGTPNNWSIKRQIGSITLNGQETYSTNSSWNYTNTSGFIYNLNNTNTNILSNRFTYSASAYSSDTNGIMGIVWSNQLLFRVSNTIASTTDGFKTWLSNNNVEVDYVLATETTEPITNQEIINQLNEIYYLQSYNGTTNITITSEDLELIMTASAIKGEA